MHLKTKGEIMIERAESQFWAYKMETENLKKGIVLLDNVQFIYELSLAELKLRELGVEIEIINNLREFRILNKSDEIIEKIKRKGVYYKTVMGGVYRLLPNHSKNQTSSVNQYLTHWIYPYKGKFHPQMIRALLNIIGLKEGDTVCDPFSGSGTTALEAQLLGINFFGLDISPLCLLQGKVKTGSIYVYGY